MNKKIILGLLLAILIIPTSLAIIKPSSNFVPFSKSPTPTPFLESTKTSKSLLKVVSTIPENKSLNAPLESTVIITFNRRPNESEFRISSLPEIPGEFKIEGNKLILKPLSPLLPSTLYLINVVLSSNKEIYSFSFNSFGPTPTPLPNTYDPGIFEKANNYERINNPDVFLSNQTPYSNSRFSVTSSYTNNPSGHFFFTVKLTGANKDASKADYINWVKSKGISESQISELDFRYQ